MLSAQAQEEPIVLTVWDEGRAVRMDMEDYLIYAVAGEMPASYEMEALKAQAVAARSYLAWKMPAFGGEGAARAWTRTCARTPPTAWPHWSRRRRCASAGGEAYAESRRPHRGGRVLAPRRARLMLYNGSPIQALFHSASGGQTRTRRRSGARRIRI